MTILLDDDRDGDTVADDVDDGITVVGDVDDIADGITAADDGASQAAATAVQARIQLVGASIRRCRVYYRGFSSSCHCLLRSS